MYDILIVLLGFKIKYYYDIYDSIINYNYDGYYVNIKFMDNKKLFDKYLGYGNFIRRICVYW